MLVYYELHDLYIEAARREKRFKNWPRQGKINLIRNLIHNGVICMKRFANDLELLDAADKPRHVGGR